MKTDVCITIDVEFTIGGAFADPYNKLPVADRAVECAVNGKSQGLGFILETLQAHDLSATFFVETLNHHFFGDAAMRGFAQQIVAAGHDVQLHLHPCWRHFQHSDWRERLNATPPNDSMAGRNPADLEALISDGIETLQRWGIPRPLALRTGGLQVDLTVYAAQARLDIPLASNVGLAVWQPQEPQLQLHGGRHWISEVLEVPTLSYCDLRLPGRRHLKTATITGSAWEELRALLWLTHHQQRGPVTILCHPSEFVKHQDLQYTRLQPNRLNQRRFQQLCRFLATHRDTFNPTTFIAAKDQWLVADSSEDPQVFTPLWATLKRLVENTLNDAFVSY